MKRATFYAEKRIANMAQGTSDEQLKLLKEELQRARAEQETQRTLQKAEIDAEKQARGEAARGRHEDMMGQLRAMRELLYEERDSRSQQVEQMDQRHAEEMRRHATTFRQMSDIQAAVTTLRDERRAHSEQLEKERARAKAGEWPAVSDIRQPPNDAIFESETSKLSRKRLRAWLRHEKSCSRWQMV